MDNPNLDNGLLTVLIDRLERRRLPRLFSLLEKVKGGERLDDFELGFLGRVISDARHVTLIIDRNPEYQDLWTKILELYGDISEQALRLEEAPENESVNP